MTDYMVKLWATWFSLGKAKKAPGTMGTLGAIPLYLLFNGLRGVILSSCWGWWHLFYGAVAKRLCTGLQIRVGRFDSGPRLQNIQ